MGDKNHIRTLGDYSRPSHEGYRNTIELPDENNVVPFRSDTIRLVQNGCSFHGHRSEDPNQHLKNFLKLVDSLDLAVANREKKFCPLVLTQQKTPNAQPVSTVRSMLSQYIPSNQAKPMMTSQKKKKIAKRCTDEDHHAMVKVESEHKKSEEEEGNTENINTNSPSQPDPSISFII
ncbi:hypothetical protein Tco_0758475 [Tanacetum coccineum]